MRRRRSRSQNAGPVESWDNTGPRNSRSCTERMMKRPSGVGL